MSTLLSRCIKLTLRDSGSTHGYDTIDHSLINPEIGTYEELVELSAKLRANGTCVFNMMLCWFACVFCQAVLTSKLQGPLLAFEVVLSF